MLFINKNEILADFFEPIRFWPYATTVTGGILQAHYDSGDRFDKLANDLIKVFRAAGIDCALDNKIAFEVKDLYDRTYFLGFKDWKFSLGTDINSDHPKKGT